MSDTHCPSPGPLPVPRGSKIHQSPPPEPPPPPTNLTRSESRRCWRPETGRPRCVRTAGPSPADAACRTRTLPPPGGERGKLKLGWGVIEDGTRTPPPPGGERGKLKLGWGVIEDGTRTPPPPGGERGKLKLEWGVNGNAVGTNIEQCTKTSF